DAPSPSGYLEEWTRRLADPIEEIPSDLLSVLIFRLAGEWLALPVAVLVQVTTTRPIHRAPHPRGAPAGPVHTPGELHLCVRLDQVLGITEPGSAGASPSPGDAPRLLVVRREGEPWVFPVDEVDQVYRFPLRDLTPVPATVGRALGKHSRG